MNINTFQLCSEQFKKYFDHFSFKKKNSPLSKTSLNHFHIQRVGRGGRILPTVSVQVKHTAELASEENAHIKQRDVAPQGEIW